MITIIGIGDEGFEGLSILQQKIIKNAAVILGGKRHIDFMPKNLQVLCQAWPSPFSKAIEQILSLRDKNVVILASGDPMFFGIGATLSRYLSRDELEILPNPSSFSLACAKLGWAMQDIACLSIHGRPLQTIHAHLQNNRRLLILSEDRTSPLKIAKTLKERGYSQSQMVVLEHLGGKKQNISTHIANDFLDLEFSDLNIVAVICLKDEGIMPISQHTSLSDDAFIHDGQLTKQNIRAITMAHLAPNYGEVLWDVGAGCGSISLEWLRSALNGRAYAIEKEEKRHAYITQNAYNLGVVNLEIIKGKAPAILHGLESPDAIFIGGGFTEQGLFEYCWQNLKIGGRLVANAVTLETAALLQNYANKINGRLIHIAVSEASSLGAYHVFRPSLPVTMLIASKTCHNSCKNMG